MSNVSQGFWKEVRGVWLLGSRGDSPLTADRHEDKGPMRGRRHFCRLEHGDDDKGPSHLPMQDQ